MQTEKTTAATAIEATEGQHPEKYRGLHDAASKNLVSVRNVLAWIVKKFVKEASRISVPDIAAKCIAGAGSEKEVSLPR